MAMSVDEVLETLEQEDVEQLQLQFTDILGVVKNVSVPIGQAEKAFDEGIYFDGSSIEGFVRIQESDMRLHPDPDTLAVLPWKDGIRTARLICDVTHPDGTPFEGDPRYVLKRAVDRADGMGMSAFAGPEAEFFVFRPDEDGSPGLTPHDTGGYFDLGPRDQADELRGNITGALESMGFEVEAGHHEVAEGQHEIDFRYEDMMRTADNLVTFRMTVRALTQLEGLHATFMPKPIAGINGSGMHTHVSLFEDGQNAFYDPDAEFNLSATARHFLAGLLEHAPAISAITNPLVNSYKRLVPGYEAPIYVAWSDVNRSALIRVPATADAEGTRFEFRCPDPSCNPYLAFAVMLQAGLDGIERELEAPDPVRENIYELTEDRLEEYGIGVLPGNLKEAIDALEADEVILDALGDHVAGQYVKAKRAEWDDYKSFVSDWEVDRYLETY